MPGSQQRRGELHGLPLRLQEPAEQLPSWQLERLEQKLPLVLRVHDRDSLVVTVPQLLLLHVGVNTLRLCVPVWSQVLEYPPHAPQLP